jgi:murein DD-endopeptidase MepM/ murein hydrolase activator NlpD
MSDFDQLDSVAAAHLWPKVWFHFGTFTKVEKTQRNHAITDAIVSALAFEDRPKKHKHDRPPAPAQPAGFSLPPASVVVGHGRLIKFLPVLPACSASRPNPCKMTVRAVSQQRGYIAMPLVPPALLRRAISIRAATTGCAAVLGLHGFSPLYGRSAEIFIRTELPHDASETAGSADGDSRSALVVVTPEASHVSFGRATDLVGRPVNYLRPIRTSQDLASLSGLAAGSLPSRMPVASYGLTSGFGMRQHPLLGVVREHSGIDLAAPLGSPIYATSDGIVSTANWRGGYGLFVSLDHGGGVQTRYGHMSQLNVTAGQQVHKGDVIGRVGSTGLSTGPHLHYEIRLNGQAVNPLPYLKPQTVNPKESQSERRRR